MDRSYEAIRLAIIEDREFCFLDSLSSACGRFNYALDELGKALLDGPFRPLVRLVEWLNNHL